MIDSVKVLEVKVLDVADLTFAQSWMSSVPALQDLCAAGEQCGPRRETWAVVKAKLLQVRFKNMFLLQVD